MREETFMLREKRVSLCSRAQCHYDQSDQSICHPHDDDTDDHIGDDFACFLSFFLITSTRHELETSIDHVDDPDESDKSEKIFHDVLGKLSDTFFGEKIVCEILGCLYRTWEGTIVSLTVLYCTWVITTCIGQKDTTCSSCKDRKSDEQTRKDEDTLKKFSHKRKLKTMLSYHMRQKYANIMLFLTWLTDSLVFESFDFAFYRARNFTE